MSIPIQEQFPFSSIIQLENDKEETHSDILSHMIQDAIDTNDEGLKEYIRMFWDNEKWESIVKKYQTEGSVWYVWWMDGVRKFIDEDRLMTMLDDTK